MIRSDYDYIIIDCPPSLNLLTINAMAAADSVIVPIQCEYYALEGLSQLIHTIDLIKERLNPKLEIEGVVFTMYDARTNLSLQVVENVKENLDKNIYKTIIPRNVRLAEAPSYGMPINMYDSRSAGAEAYRYLAVVSECVVSDVVGEIRASSPRPSPFFFFTAIRFHPLSQLLLLQGIYMLQHRQIGNRTY